MSLTLETSPVSSDAKATSTPEEHEKTKEELMKFKPLLTREPARRTSGIRTLKPASYAQYLEPTTKTLVLSDVDGTLVRGSLVLDHACELHERGLLDLGLWPQLWRADPKNEKYIYSLAEAYRGALVGRKESELLIPEFVESVLSNENKLYSTLNRLKSHHGSGHQVLLISGSPSFLLKPFAESFGFSFVGSRYHRDRSRKLTGLVTGMFGAPQKAAVVSKLQLSDYERIIGYGDTASDVPLLLAAHYSVLVDPNEETLRKLGTFKVSEIIRS